MRDVYGMLQYLKTKRLRTYNNFHSARVISIDTSSSESQSSFREGNAYPEKEEEDSFDDTADS